MSSTVRKLFELPRIRSYSRPTPLVLVNGLAEQSESWFANRVSWSRHFDVKTPDLLVYDGPALHDRITSGKNVSVNYLTDRLTVFLDEFVQRPPYHLVGSSLGGQVVLTYAIRYPEKVDRLVLICPSGFHGNENLPMIEGVRRSNYDALVESVFHRSHFATSELVGAVAQKFQSRTWKKGVLRTLRGTVGHSVAPILDLVTQPTLIIWGDHDRILSDVPGSVRAGERIPKASQAVIPNCGHAPQIEKASLVNPLVTRYLLSKLASIPPDLDHRRYLRKTENGLLSRQSAETPR